MWMKICSVNFFYLRKNARHAEQHKISAVLVRPFRAWLAKHSWQKVHDPTRLDRFDLTTHQQKSLSHSTTDTHITHTSHTQQPQQRQRRCAIAVLLALTFSQCSGFVECKSPLALALALSRLLSFWWRGKTFVAFGWFAHCRSPPPEQQKPPPPPPLLLLLHHYVDVDVSAALHSLSLSCSFSLCGWVRNLLELSRSLEETRSVLVFSASLVSY